MRGWLCKRAVAERGSVALEFALGIPLFFSLFFAVLDVTRLLLVEDLINRITESLAYYYKFEVSLDVREKKGLEGLSAATISNR